MVEENPIQLIPPEFSINTDESARDEDCRGQLVAFEKRLRKEQIVRISVIKRDGY